MFGFVTTAALALAFVTIEQAARHPMPTSGALCRSPIQCRQRIGDRHLLLSGRLYLPHYSVLPGVARVQPARHRPADPAVALSIAIGSICGGLLAPRIGTRTVVVSGLISFGTAMAWDRRQHRHRHPYPTIIVPQMLLMGLGIGLVSTPATESIMLVLPPSRA